MSTELQRSVQTDWSAGMFQARNPLDIPRNGAWEILNGLLNEEGAVYRRGGTFRLPEDNSLGAPQSLWVGAMGKEIVQVMFKVVSGKLFVDSGGAMTEAGVVRGGGAPALNGGMFRITGLGGLAFIPGLFGVTNTARMVEFKAGVKLVEPTIKGHVYAAAGSRLLGGGENGNGEQVNKIFFSDVNAPGKFTENNFHGLPTGVQIIGMIGVRDACAVFTTQGVWMIGNLNLELTDAEGNIQQTLDLYDGSIRLWGDAGLASWETSVVVPARDGVWLMTVGAKGEPLTPMRLISRPIEALYQGYEAAGYEVGVGAVYNGHYFLPIVARAGGVTLIDVLVCRLNGVDSRGNHTFAWTHFQGAGACAAFAVTFPGGSTPETDLVGSTAAGALLACNYMTPGVAAKQANDGTNAGESAIAFRVVNVTPTGNLVPNFVASVRVSYTLTKATAAVGEPVISLRYSTDPRSEAVLEPDTGGVSALGGEFRSRVRRKGKLSVVTLETGAKAATCSVESIETFTRPDGRL
jgi:hypothetical protein